MSITINLLLLTQTTEKPGAFLKSPHASCRSCTMWKIDTVLNIGNISRPGNKKDFENFSIRRRAAMYFLDCLWPELSRQSDDKKEECFAPPFSILYASKEEKLSTVWEWAEKFQDSKDSREEFIEPLYESGIGQQIPTQRTMEKHNRAIEDAPSPNNLVMGPALVWFSCAEVAEWISQQEHGERYKDTVLKDPETLTYLTIWKTCLIELGKINARCLFIFESVKAARVV